MKEPHGHELKADIMVTTRCESYKKHHELIFSYWSDGHEMTVKISHTDKETGQTTSLAVEVELAALEAAVTALRQLHPETPKETP